MRSRRWFISWRTGQKALTSTIADVITVKLTGGETATLPAKRLTNIFWEVIAQRDTPETALLLLRHGRTRWRKVRPHDRTGSGGSILTANALVV